MNVQPQINVVINAKLVKKKLVVKKTVPLAVKRCNGDCTADKQCCDKCTAGKANSCCTKDSTGNVSGEKKACCSKDAENKDAKK
jgi:hypothetical protein